MMAKAKIVAGKFSFILLIILLGCVKLYAQTEKDTTIILINDVGIKLRTTQALNDMYNFKFEKAEAQFQVIKENYPWHPLPYFLLGLSEWWKIMPNVKDTSHDEKFLAYMDSTIMTAENLHEKYEVYQVEAAFFLAAAYGFKGRLYADEERKNWRKAAVVGKTALDYLEECKEKDNLSIELLFGDALYNYFSVWVPENYPILKPMLWFFRKGDKQLGLKQLNEVAYNAYYTRTEAMVWLMRITNGYENDQVKAYQISQFLHETYPDNPYFHRYYARMLYGRRLFTDLEKTCVEILARIDGGMLGYEATSGRYATFFLGQFYESRNNLDEAKKNYLMCVKFSEQIEATESGYYLFSLIALGEINQRQGNKAEAKRYFKEVKDKSGRKDEAYQDAKRRLKELEKGD